MGSRVNVRFVAILSAVLVGVVGLLAVPAYLVLTKSAADHARAGDKAMEAGDYKQAISHYGKAVNEERSNVEYVTKWREAIESFTPSDQTEYRKYFSHLYGAIYEIAYASKNDLAAWEEYFQYARMLDSASRIEERARAAAELVGDPREAAIIRRNMALPKLEEWVNGSRQMEAAEIEMLEAQLRSALEARPDDHEVAGALVKMHRHLAALAMQNFDEEAAAEHARAARDVVDGFLAKNPDHALFAMTALGLEADPLLRRLVGDPIEQGSSPITPSEVDRIAALLEDWPAEKVTLDDIGRLQTLELYAGDGGLPRSLALTRRLVEERPQDMVLRWGRAFILRLAGRHEEAYEQLQVLLDRPIQTVSLGGYRLFNIQDQALYAQSGLAFDQWERAAGDEQTREIALQRMRSRNEELTRRLAADSPLLLMARARIAFAEGEHNEARRLLREYEDRLGMADDDANWMLTQLAMGAGNMTEAARRLDLYMENNPGQLRAMALRADIHRRLGEEEEAIEILTKLQRAFPDNEQIASVIGELQAASGQIVPDDPVLAAISRAREAELGSGDRLGDSDRARAILEEAIGDGLSAPPLFRALAQIHLGQGDVGSARDAIERGLATNPSDEGLLGIRDALASGETVLDVTIAMIDAGEGTELDKLAAKARVCASNGALDRAREFLQRASAIDAEHPEVVNLSFQLAVNAGDLTRARELAQVAQQRDIDGVGGRTFAATVRALESDEAGAVSLLQEAVDLRPDRVDLLQRLGRTQIAAGQAAQGVSTYERAMQLRGTDQRLILDFVTQLRAAGRPEQALRLLLSKQDATRGNQAIFDLRIDLEAQVGDRKWALETRKALAERDPSNRSNQIKLARLYMDEARWADAKPLLDALRAEGDSLELATIAAQWHGEQGDIESARQEFTRYIGAVFNEKGDLDDPTPYLQLAQVLIRYGDVEGGLNAIRQARRWEDPETLNVEKFLAERLSALGRIEEAIASYRAILDAGKDTPDADYALRLAEALGRLGRYQEAEELLAGLEHLESRNESILIVRSQNAMQMGEQDKARDLAQRAIDLFPQSARAYAQRARLALMLAMETGNERLLLDAREDLGTAIDRDPSYVDAFRLRAQANSYLGNRDAMLADMRGAVFARPPTNQVAAQAITTFLRAGRAGGAVEIADYATQMRPNDLALLRDIGGAFADAGDWGRASAYFERAWQRSRDLITAARYVQSLLRASPPRSRAALEALGSLGAQVSTSPGLMILRAEALHVQGQTAVAIEDARRAFALLADNEQGLALWFGEMNRIFDTPETFRAVVEAAKRGGSHRMLLDLYAARAQAEGEQTLGEAVRIFDGLIAQQENPAIQRTAYVFKGEALMRRERFEDAVATWRAGLERYPEHWQMHNNIAYVLGERLGRPQEALPHAEAAFERAPNVAAIADTLGWIQHLLGNEEAAELTLDQAVSLIGSPENDPTVALHLAIVRAALGKKELATNLVRTIRVTTQNGANLDATDKELLAEASERIDSLP